MMNKTPRDKPIIGMSKRKSYLKFPKTGTAIDTLHIRTRILNLKAMSLIPCLNVTIGFPHDDFTIRRATIRQLLIGLFSGGPANWH
jgi:hypothetical protein